MFYKNWEKEHKNKKEILTEMLESFKDDLLIVELSLTEENELINQYLIE